MADSKNSKISELTELTDPSNADFIPIVDTANTETKKISYSSLIAALNTDDDSYSKTETDALIASGMWYYANQAAFPAAADNHGRVVHSHADGSMYYAHSGSWHKIENEAEAEAARAVIQADVDQNEVDANSSIANLASTHLGYINNVQNQVTINNAKVGITTAQASAITANTAKTGITTAQASAITANTAKVGITTAQADAITANTADIATNTTNIASKAPIADPDFTGTVGIAKSGVSGVLDIDGDVYIENGKINGETGSVDFSNNQAQLILGTFKSDAVKVQRVDANSTLIFGVDASSETTGKATMLNAEVSNDLTVSGKSVIKEIESFGGGGGSPDGITIDALHGTLNLNADDNVEVDATGTIKLDAGQTVTLSSDLIINDGDIDVDLDHRISVGQVVTSKILCEGAGGHSTAQPITYDSKEHRFRDYDGSTNGPTNMLVVNKFDGYTGARVGINKDPSASNNVALHVVAGKNSSTNAEDLGLKVVGGSFFEDFIRVGHYTDTTRGQISNPTNGTIIYNSQHHEFQGYVGGGTGWQKFNMGAVSS